MANPELTHRPSALDRKARALIRATSSHGVHKRSASCQLARGLGWMSLGLGVVAWVAARPLSRAFRLPEGGL